MLRRSTGWSLEWKRVGVLRGTERCWLSWLNCRCVASARSGWASAAEVASGVVVGIGGLLAAMDWRRRVRGSSESEAMADGDAEWVCCGGLCCVDGEVVGDAFGCELHAKLRAKALL